MIVWPERRDRFAEYCRGLPPHPAEDALDAAHRERLGRAEDALDAAHRERLGRVMAYGPPSEPDRWPLDTPGAF